MLYVPMQPVRTGGLGLEDPVAVTGHHFEAEAAVRQCLKKKTTIDVKKCRVKLFFVGNSLL